MLRRTNQVSGHLRSRLSLTAHPVDHAEGVGDSLRVLGPVHDVIPSGSVYVGVDSGGVVSGVVPHLKERASSYRPL